MSTTFLTSTKQRACAWKITRSDEGKDLVALAEPLENLAHRLPKLCLALANVIS